MAPTRHPLIAREGWPHLVVVLAAALLATALWGVWSLPEWLLALFVLQFFRDPPRSAPQDPGLVTAPADGRVIVVERARDPYLDRDALKISIFMNVFNVHSNRCPVTGEVRDRWYHPGSFLNAALSKASAENERMALWIRCAEGADVVCVQVAGLVARRILCYAKPGDRLVRGVRYGFIRFGSRVDLYLPPDARPLVGVGDRVSAATQVVATLAGY